MARCVSRAGLGMHLLGAGPGVLAAHDNITSASAFWHCSFSFRPNLCTMKSPETSDIALRVRTSGSGSYECHVWWTQLCERRTACANR